MKVIIYSHPCDCEVHNNTLLCLWKKISNKNKEKIWCWGSGGVMDREERNWTMWLCPVGIPHLKIRKSECLNTHLWWGLDNGEQQQETTAGRRMTSKPTAQTTLKSLPTPFLRGNTHMVATGDIKPTLLWMDTHFSYGIDFPTIGLLLETLFSH